MCMRKTRDYDFGFCDGRVILLNECNISKYRVTDKKSQYPNSIQRRNATTTMAIERGVSPIPSC